MLEFLFVFRVSVEIIDPGMGETDKKKLSKTKITKYLTFEN